MLPIHFALVITALVLGGCAVVEDMRCPFHVWQRSGLDYPIGMLVPCFDHFDVSDSVVTHPVYCLTRKLDASKPPLLLLHELPSLSPKTLYYAEELSKEFTVYVPLLFGTLNQDSFLAGVAAVHNGEWTQREELAGSMRITKWLQHLVNKIESKHPDQWIGAIGNCLTGTLPLALLRNKRIRAVVVAQPTLPNRFFYYTAEDSVIRNIRN